MPREIPGDPLTGSLPVTQLVAQGPARQRRERPRDAWPIVPDSIVVGDSELEVGRVASVRTRRGTVRVLVRVVNKSYERANRGRHYFVGQTRRGWCRSFWVSEVIRVETLQRAIATRSAIDAKVIEHDG